MLLWNEAGRLAPIVDPNRFHIAVDESAAPVPSPLLFHHLHHPVFGPVPASVPPSPQALAQAQAQAQTPGTCRNGNGNGNGKGNEEFAILQDEDANEDGDEKPLPYQVDLTPLPALPPVLPPTSSFTFTGTGVGAVPREAEQQQQQQQQPLCVRCGFPLFGEEVENAPRIPTEDGLVGLLCWPCEAAGGNHQTQRHMHQNQPTQYTH